MLILLKKISLPIIFGFSILLSANEMNVEVNMESVLEVGRENQTLSASSQDKIDQTERQTDNLMSNWFRSLLCSDRYLHLHRKCLIPWKTLFKLILLLDKKKEEEELI
jgi:hypothetical protein